MIYGLLAQAIISFILSVAFGMMMNERDHYKKLYQSTMNQLTITQTLIPDTEWDIN